MDDRDVHYALASPADVEAWSRELLAEKSTRRAHDYWLRIRRFYDWLQWHTDHPHVYNPVLLAVVEGDAAREIWYEKIARWQKARERYERGSDE